MKTIEIIKIDWTDLKSIKAGEKKKARLENLCYSLLSTTVGLNRSEFLYELKGHKSNY